MWRATSYRAHSQFAWKSSVPPGDALSRSKMSGFYCGERPPAPDRLRPAEPTQHCRVHPWMGCASWRCRRASCRAIGAHPAGPAAFAHAHGVIAARCAQGAAFARHARRADCVARRTASRGPPRAATREPRSNAIAVRHRAGRRSRSSIMTSLPDVSLHSVRIRLSASVRTPNPIPPITTPTPGAGRSSTILQRFVVGS